MRKKYVQIRGLILTATSFEGYCCLEWQMYTYTIGREYFVVGQGVAKVPERTVDERIFHHMDLQQRAS